MDEQTKREMDFLHQYQIDLECRVKALETIVESVSEALEKAKENPIVANMLSMIGM